jgi:hypothetical protein
VREDRGGDAMEGGFERGSAATARGLPFVRKAPAKPVMRFEEADPTGWQQHRRRSPEAFSGAISRR